MFGDEVDDIANVMLKQVKSSKKKQVNWMKGKNFQEFVDNRKHVVVVWRRNEMETTIGKLQ